MHANLYNGWFCGPGGLFSDFQFGGLFHLVFWGIVLFLIFKATSYFFSQASPKNSFSGKASNAIAILEERYAAGEIDREEFIQRKKDLTS